MATKQKTRPPAIQKVATIRQVAELAGVSIATVSRVFAGADQVSDELNERVQVAARSLNYKANRVAQNLRLKTTNTVALVISDIENPFFTSVVRGVESVLRGEGYSLFLTNSDEDEEIELELLLNLRAERVAGIILAATCEDSKRYEQFVQAGMRIVAIDRVPKNLKIDRVTVNNIDGIQQAVKHLVEQGHTKIGFIAGLARISTSYERQAGFELGMQAHGLQIHPEWMKNGIFRREYGYQAMMSILELDDRPTAVITANNLMTQGALQAIYKSKLSIPADMAIVGFDYMPWADFINPPLSVVAQPTRDLGIIAAQLLLDRIKDHGRSYQHVILDTELIIRESSGPHAAA